MQDLLCEFLFLPILASAQMPASLSLLLYFLPSRDLSRGLGPGSPCSLGTGDVQEDMEKGPRGTVGTSGPRAHPMVCGSGKDLATVNSTLNISADSDPMLSNFVAF